MEDRGLTIHFNDGSKTSIAFPKQTENDMAASLRLGEALAARVLVIDRLVVTEQEEPVPLVLRLALFRGHARDRAQLVEDVAERRLRDLGVGGAHRVRWGGRGPVVTARQQPEEEQGDPDSHGGDVTRGARLPGLLGSQRVLADRGVRAATRASLDRAESPRASWP